MFYLNGRKYPQHCSALLYVARTLDDDLRGICLLLVAPPPPA
jgi:hypothetical protein